MANVTTALLLYILVSTLGNEIFYYKIDSLSGRIIVHKSGRLLRLEEVRFEKSKIIALSSAEISALAPINFLSARCRISAKSYLRGCQIFNASTGNKISSAFYIKLLENLKAIDCGKYSCHDGIITVYMRFSIPAATGAPTKICIPPFCAATPLAPRAPTREK